MSNVRLGMSIAQRYVNVGAEMADLIQATVESNAISIQGNDHLRLILLVPFIFISYCVLVFCTTLFTGSVIALGAIVSAKPLDDLGYKFKGWMGEHNNFTSPYASPVCIGWDMASAIVLVVTGVLSIVSWFASYWFSLFSAMCVGIFAVVLVLFFHVSLKPQACWHLVEEIPDCIDKLAQAGIKLWVLTRDKMETALHYMIY